MQRLIKFMLIFNYKPPKTVTTTLHNHAFLDQRPHNPHSLWNTHCDAPHAAYESLETTTQIHHASVEVTERWRSPSTVRRATTKTVRGSASDREACRRSGERRRSLSEHRWGLSRVTEQRGSLSKSNRPLTGPDRELQAGDGELLYQIEHRRCRIGAVLDQTRPVGSDRRSAEPNIDQSSLVRGKSSQIEPRQSIIEVNRSKSESNRSTIWDSEANSTKSRVTGGQAVSKLKLPHPTQIPHPHPCRIVSTRVRRPKRRVRAT